MAKTRILTISHIENIISADKKTIQIDLFVRELLNSVIKEIAEMLNISIYTVEQHKKNIKKKLELSTIGELIHFAMTSHLVEFSVSV